MNIPTIGIAGVTIPGAVDCIQKINRASSKYFSKNEHPHIVLNQPNFGTLQTAFFEDDWSKVAEELSVSAKKLAQMGADFVIIPANTVHRVIADVHSPIPVLNMLDIVSAECKTKNMKKVGILGTVWTMSGHLYAGSLKAYGIEECIPSQEEQKIIQEAIFSELVPTGRIQPDTLAAMLSVVQSLQLRGCDGIALACTELPLVLNSSNCGLPVLDTTDILAQASVFKASNTCRSSI